MNNPEQHYLYRRIPLLTLTVLLSAVGICSAQYNNVPYSNQPQPQYSADYPSSTGYTNSYGFGGNYNYNSQYNPQPSTLYTASRETLPQGNNGASSQPAPVAEPPKSTTVAEAKPEEQKSSNPLTRMYRSWFKSSSKEKTGSDAAAVKPSQDSTPAPDARISDKEYANKGYEGTKTSAPEKKAWYEFWKKSEGNENANREERELDTSVDKGQAEVELMEQERSFSEQDYVGSAVKSSKTTAKDDYSQGLQLEGLGDYTGAARCYNNFIKANKKQTANGTLAAPYHRLALLAWKQKELDKADVYFRYGQRYAQGGNIAIISGDYSLFLMEQGKLEQAEVILRNTLLYFPKDQRLLICLGRCTARRDKPVEALRYLTSVMSEEQAYHELAGLYQQTGDYKSAQIMNEKRDELFAKRSADSIYASSQTGNSVRQYAVNNPANMQNMPLPVNKPPVMNSAVNTAPAIPYPMITGLPAGSQAVSSPYRLPQETNNVPAVQPVTVSPNEQQNTQNTPVLQQEQTVTKVYHYPANSPSPVYHQYAGNSYPQMVPVTVQSVSNPKDVKNYWASMVPDTAAPESAGFAAMSAPADPFAVQPVPMVAEQRGGYPQVPSYPQNNVQ